MDIPQKNSIKQSTLVGMAIAVVSVFFYVRPAAANLYGEFIAPAEQQTPTSSVNVLTYTGTPTPIWPVFTLQSSNVTFRGACASSYPMASNTVQLNGGPPISVIGTGTNGQNRYGWEYATTVSPGDTTVSFTCVNTNGETQVTTQVFRYTPGSPPDINCTSNTATVTIAAGQTARGNYTCSAVNSFTGYVAAKLGPEATLITLAAGSGPYPSAGITFYAYVQNGYSFVRYGPGTTDWSIDTERITPPGTYQVDLHVAINGNPVIDHVFPVTIIVTDPPPQDFSVAANPAAFSVVQGTAGHFVSQVPVAAAPSYVGTVNLAASGLPAGATAAFTPQASATLNNNSRTITLTIDTPATLGVGTYPISVVGTAGTLTHETPIVITVTAAPVSGYDCTSNACVVNPTGGAFATLIACAASGCGATAPGVGYNCTSNQCVESPGVGTFTSLAACAASGCGAPPGTKYACKGNGVCMAASDGAYDTPAACTAACPTTGGTTSPGRSALKSSFEGLMNPIKCDNARCLFLQIIQYFLAGVAVVSTLMLVWGGYLFLTSAGNAEQVKKAKTVILWTTVGILIIIGSWIVVRTLLTSLTG